MASEMAVRYCTSRDGSDIGVYADLGGGARLFDNCYYLSLRRTIPSLSREGRRKIHNYFLHLLVIDYLRSSISI